MRKRHHYIPKVLLRRFSDEDDKSNSKIWMYRREMKPIKTSLDNVAVSKWFYGDDDVLEDLLSKHENEYTNLLAYAESASDREKHKLDIAQMVWSLAVRTQALRLQFSGAVDQLLGQFASADTQNLVNQGIASRAEKTIDEEINKFVNNFPEIGRKYILNNPALLASIRERALQQIKTTDFSVQISEITERIKQSSAENNPMQTGQISGLMKLLQRSPPKFLNDFKWSLIHSDQQPLILGDCVVLSADKNGVLSPALRNSETRSYVLLPVSPQSVLVGQLGDKPFTVPFGTINQHSAQYSTDAFFACRNTQYELDLYALLGHKSQLFSDVEIREIIINAFEKRA